MLLKEEADMLNQDYYAVYDQLVFFSCYNKILDEVCQRDIKKYVYCNETNTPTHKGSYGEQPSKWVTKYFIIKDAMDVRIGKLRESKKDGS